MKMGTLYENIDAPIKMCDNDGHDYTLQECEYMDVISIRIVKDYILIVVDKFSE